jgi:hypothetical protein
LPEPEHNLGVTLMAQGRLAEAVGHFQEALRLNPKLPLTHAALGKALLDQGRCGEAQAAIRCCLDLLPTDHPQRAVTLQLSQRCERWLALDGRLTAVLEGRDKPSSDAEGIQFAALCRAKKQYLAAARLSVATFAASPRLAESPENSHRYNAACAAVLAGCGEGTDGTKLGEAERARWRKQARDWLRADLDAWANKLGSGPALARAQVIRALAPWRADADLIGLREPDPLDKLPRAEREECRALWRDVDALLERARLGK